VHRENVLKMLSKMADRSQDQATRPRGGLSFEDEIRLREHQRMRGPTLSRKGIPSADAEEDQNTAPSYGEHSSSSSTATNIQYGEPPACLMKGSAFGRDLSDLFVPNEGGRKRSYAHNKYYDSHPNEAGLREVAGAPPEDQGRGKKSKRERRLEKEKEKSTPKSIMNKIFNAVRPTLTVIPEDEAQEKCPTPTAPYNPAQADIESALTSSCSREVSEIPLPQGNPNSLNQHMSDVHYITALLKMDGDNRAVEKAYLRLTSQPTDEDPLRRAQNLLFKTIMTGRDIISHRERAHCHFAPVHQQFHDLPEQLRRDYYNLVADINETYQEMTPEAKNHAIERLLGYLWSWMNDGANQRIGREAMQVANEEIKLLQAANTHLIHSNQACQREVTHYRISFDELYMDYKDDDHPEHRWNKRCKLLNDYFLLALKTRDQLYTKRRKEDKHYSPDIRSNLLVDSLRYNATVDEWYDVMRHTAEFHWAVIRKKEDESLEDFLMTNYEIVRSLYADIARDCAWPNSRRKLALFNRLDSRLRAYVIEKGILLFNTDRSVNYQYYCSFILSCEKELSKKKKAGRKKASSISSAAITVEPAVCDLCKEEGHERNDCWEVITYDDGPLWQRLGHSHFTRQNWPDNAPSVEEVLREQIDSDNAEENGENNNGVDGNEYVPEYPESTQADEPPQPPGTD